MPRLSSTLLAAAILMATPAIAGAQRGASNAQKVDKARAANRHFKNGVALYEEGKYKEALAELSAVQQGNRDARTAEVLSFERGTLLERLAGPAVSCLHWRNHLQQFPKGAYHAAVSAKLGAACATNAISPGK
jgi:TolA-binding protein